MLLYIYLPIYLPSSLFLIPSCISDLPSKILFSFCLNDTFSVSFFRMYLLSNKLPQIWSVLKCIHFHLYFWWIFSPVHWPPTLTVIFFNILIIISLFYSRFSIFYWEVSWVNLIVVLSTNPFIFPAAFRILFLSCFLFSCFPALVL